MELGFPDSVLLCVHKDGVLCVVGIAVACTHLAQELMRNLKIYLPFQFLHHPLHLQYGAALVNKSSPVTDMRHFSGSSSLGNEPN